MSNIKINYEDSFVAFLDVLGFKSLLKSDDKSKLETYFNIAERQIQDLKSSTHIKSKLKSIVISDSIILCIEKSQNLQENIKKLRELCVAIAKIQSKLICNGIYLRGAVSSGPTYFDEHRNQIVGQAFVDAYELESSIVKYPRVILDIRLVNLLPEESRSHTNLIANVNRLGCSEINSNKMKNPLLCMGGKVTKDQPLLINFFEALFIFEDEESLEMVFNNIHFNLYNNPYHYEKFKWTLDYLNQFLHCERFRNKLSSSSLEKFELLEYL